MRAFTNPWATALFALGEKEGVKKAQQLNLTTCFLRQATDGELMRHMTCGFGEKLPP